MTELPDRVFGELPAALVDELLNRSADLSQHLLSDFQHLRKQYEQWRHLLTEAKLLGREADLAYPTIPTTCGIDGAYAVERLLASDLVAAAAVAVEGLTPPSETRYWPEPRHRAWIEAEVHDSDTGTILRALMIGFEMQLAHEAPHQVVLLDGSLTTPLIYFNQALNKCRETGHLKTTQYFLERIPAFLTTYHSILQAQRSDRCWISIPKYTTRREIGHHLNWSSAHDDRSVLSFVLAAGEYTQPVSLQQPDEPWHLNVEPSLRPIATEIIQALSTIQVVYYRPFQWLPALRLEMAQAIASNRHRLAEVLHGIRHQCGTPAVLEPYPLYMADRMVKHLAIAIPTLRQIAGQQMAESYQGDINDVFMGLHGYRTESGV
ncbi:MAG: hypothetical protein KatS3mg055_0620 [Chloroflexus sp.]|uniref:DNA double-strand break repair nuclease NurA n=1 Tax=Chloroflexus sp. TaxID=1904827 RepID=UPI0021DD045C|nr:DNA double-strand break repair nuclease NurA [Chloroflexus sp.]GIV88102.1 MAG: hypothetical protein KatS3mg055_0620 [Chloroflexus sp.]